MASTTAATTTSRSDFTWPFLAQKQRTYNWDRYEFKAERPLECTPPPPQWFRSAETLSTIPYAQRLRFDFDFRPKPISSGLEGRPHVTDDDRRPTERAIRYARERETARTAARSTRPRVFKCPQISLDDVPADRRDMVCEYAYITSKTMSELTSGVPLRSRPSGHVDAPSSRPFGCDPGTTFRPEPLYKAINPPKNWRRVSIEWDESQRRIFGGRSTE